MPSKRGKPQPPHRTVPAVVVESEVARTVASAAGARLSVTKLSVGATWFFVRDDRFPKETFRVSVERWPR